MKNRTEITIHINLPNREMIVLGPTKNIDYKFGVMVLTITILNILHGLTLG